MPFCPLQNVLKIHTISMTTAFFSPPPHYLHISQPCTHTPPVHRHMHNAACPSTPTPIPSEPNSYALGLHDTAAVKYSNMLNTARHSNYSSKFGLNHKFQCLGKYFCLVNKRSFLQDRFQKKLLLLYMVPQMTWHFFLFCSISFLTALYCQ